VRATAALLCCAAAHAGCSAPGPGKLRFAAPPGDAIAGQPVSVRVLLLDEEGVANKDFGGSATIRLQKNPSGDELDGRLSVSVSGGAAVFEGLTLHKAASGYTFFVQAPGFAPAETPPFAVKAAAASTIRFSTQPSDVAAGTAMTPPVRVSASDAFGNVAADWVSAVALAVKPSDGGLLGNTSVYPVDGVATFDAISLRKPGAGYSLHATSESLAADSRPFSVLPGAPARLVFVQQPSDIVAGVPFSPAVSLALEDAFGNPATSSTASVTIEARRDDASAPVLGTAVQAAVGGVATFDDASVGKAGNGWTLTASSPGVEGATSEAFNVARGPAAALAFTRQPQSAEAGDTFSVAVSVVDATGNPVEDASDRIGLWVLPYGSGATLLGTVTRTAAAGVAVFDDLSLRKSGRGYALAAYGAGLRGATSSEFDVLPGPAAQLAFAQQPGDAVAGVAVSPAVRVVVQDRFGNPVPQSSAVVAVSAEGGSPGALRGTLSARAADGVAVFGDLELRVAGAGWTLLAQSPGLAAARSAAFAVHPALPAELSFATQPPASTAGRAMSPAPSVAVLDAFGNRVVDSAMSISLSLKPGAAAATLLGTATRPVAGGIASFGDLRLERAGAGYVLVAAAPNLPQITSDPFAVAPAAGSQLAFRVPPSDTLAGVAPSPAVAVAVLDPYGNTADSSARISLREKSGASLFGASAAVASSGVAVFGDLNLRRAGTGYVLMASAVGLAEGSSPPFDVAAAAPAKLSFAVEPSDAAAGEPLDPPPAVLVLDAFENPARGSHVGVSISIASAPEGAALFGTTTRSSAAAVAAFDGVSVRRAGTFSLLAASGSLVSATSRAFRIRPAAPRALAFVASPADSAAGQPFDPPVVVAVRDAYGNTVDSSAQVSLSVGTGPEGASLSGTAVRTATSGLASFDDVSLRKAGSCTFKATAASLAPAASAAFLVSPGPAAALAFAVQPTDTIAGNAIAPTVTVEVQDAFGNRVDASTAEIAVGAGLSFPGTDVLGSRLRSAVAGTAAFDDLVVRKAGTCALRAASEGLMPATSVSFEVSAAAPAALAFAVAPADSVAGTVLAPSVVVAIQDEFGNTTPDSVASVDLALESDPSVAVLLGTRTREAAAGIAVFNDLSIEKSGSYRLRAVEGTLSGALSGPFLVAPAPAEGMAFDVQPSDTVAGASLSPGVRVSIRDAFGNLADAAFDVSLSLDSVEGATLLGTTTVAAVGGIAEFYDLSVRKAGAYALSASAAELPTVSSRTFAVVAGPPAALAFAVQPSSTPAGSAISPSVTVVVRDAFANTVSDSAAVLVLSLASNPAGGSLTGTTSRASVSGVAQFDDISVRKAGSYSIGVSGGGLPSATSDTFTISPAAAAVLAFATVPSDTVAGSVLSPTPVVEVRDAYGNRTESTASVAIAFASDSGGATLLGTTNRTAEAGAAAFDDLSIRKAGTYSLAASGGSLAAATSPAFGVSAASPEALAFVAQPADLVAGAVLSPAVTVAVRDAYGNTSIPSTASVALTLAPCPNGAALLGTSTRAAVAGIATFSDLSLRKAGGCSLNATSGTLAPATSASFQVSPASATSLSFAAQPTSTIAGSVLAPAVAVSVVDPWGNVVPAPGITITLDFSSNTTGAVLVGTTARAAVGGTATFDDLAVRKAGSYSVRAAGGSLASVESLPFAIAPGPASALAFRSQPTGAVAGTTLSPAVSVAVVDSFGNTVAASTAEIGLAISSGPAAGTLLGTATCAAVAGVASFDALSIRRTGTYVLATTSEGLTPATGTAFSVAPAAPTALAFTAQPADVAAGATIPAVAVSVLDPWGNTVAGSTAAVSLSIGAGPSGALLLGTTTRTAVSGTAGFDDLAIRKAGTCDLRASSGSLSAATSAAFLVSPAAASVLAFRVQPGAAIAGAVFAPAPVVALQDAWGNLVPDSGTSIALSLASPADGAVLLGTTAQATVDGLAAFDDLELRRTGSYALEATAGEIGPKTSAMFVVSSAPADALAFDTQPAGAVAGATITPAVAVSVRDVWGNIVADSAATVELSLDTSQAVALLGTTSRAASGGTASFADLSVRTAGTYSLAATSGTLIPAAGTRFDVVPGAASTLAFTIQATDAVAGAVVAPAVEVAVKDAWGNTATSSSATVALSIASGPVGATLFGTVSRTASGGLAAFGDLSLKKAGTYSLRATSVALAAAAGNSFAIAPASASSLVFASQPANATAGTVLSPAVSVAVLDSYGNRVTGATDSITLSFASNPTEAPLLGTATRAAAAGLATFDDVSIRKVGTFTLRASAADLLAATSAGFAISPAAASALAFTTQPAAVTAGSTLAPAVVVAVLDSYGNTVTGSSAPVAISIGSGPSGATLLGTASRSASGGVATFNDLSLRKAGTFTLAAASGSLAAATSAPFEVSPASGALAFTVQPSTTAAGTALAPVVVAVQDTYGNLLADSTASVTLVFTSNSGGATLLGTTTRSAVGGLAAFNDLSIQKTGSYSFTATSLAFSSAASGTFQVTAAEPASLAFSVQPAAASAGATFAPSVGVAVLDTYGNLVSDSTAPVALSFASNPTGATLLGTVSKSAVNGTAVFADLSIRVAGTYSLAASSGILATPTSSPFVVSAAAASALAILSQTADAVAGATLAPLSVAVQDAYGNTVASSTASIAATFASAPPGAALLGTATKAASGGLASFNDLSVRVAGSYSLRVASGSLAAATGAVFAVSPAAPSTLAFTSQPAGTTAGASLSPAVAVAVRDAFGNTVVSSDAAISLSLGSNPTGATLAGTTARQASAGIATFDDVSVRKTGTYTLVASSGASTAATSASFAISPAAASALAFTVQPADCVAGATLAPAVAVAVQDAWGNTVASSTAGIALAFATNPTGASLLGTTSHVAAGGVALFGDLSIRKAGTYSFSASSGSLSAATSASFTVSPGSGFLVFSVQPSDSVAGAMLSPSVVVAVQDGFGNVLTTSAANVTVALGSNPAGATLLGSTTRTASAGIAVFNDLNLQKTGAFTLTAASPPLAGATSTSFAVTPAPAASLSFSAQPSATVAGALFSPSVAVEVLDSFGNRATGSTASIALSFASNPTGATLLGTVTRTAAAGLATFSDLSIRKTGTYSLGATSGSLGAATSNSFSISTGATAALAFTGQPQDASAGATLSPVSVSVQDAWANTVPGSAAAVVLALDSCPSGAVLLGTTTRNASAGIAAFGDLSVRKAGACTLRATSGTLAAATSSAFTISAAAPAALGFTVQPSGTGAGSTIAPAVSILDSYGNTATTSTALVSVAISSGPVGATLLGTSVRGAVAGVAAFDNLSLRKAGTYVLGASSGSLASANSSTFIVSPAAATTLSFTVQPSATTAGSILSPAPAVAVLDDYGNTVTGSSASITLGFASNPTGATLSGTAAKNASAGVATFTDISVQKAGTYTLSATSGSLAASTSASFTVAPATGVLAFAVQPSSATAGAATSPAVVVAVQDSFGNVVTSSSAAITLVFGSNPTDATLLGTTTQTAVSGIATFPDISIQKTGTYTLRATSGTLTATTSGSFAISPASADRLAFATQPSAASAGATISPAVTVAVQDAYGNPVTSSTASVALALASNPGGATLLGTVTRNAVAGVATFNDLSIRKSGTCSLGATSGTLAAATSASFSVSAGTAVALGFTVQPASIVAGATLSPAVVVAVQDTYGNTVTGSTASLSLGFGANPSGATLLGTVVRTAVSGTATFDDLRIQRAGSGYAFAASSSGLGSAASNAFNVNPGTATSLRFLVQPGTCSPNAPISPALQVAAIDSFGNTSPLSGAQVTMTIATGPSGAHLGGTLVQTPAGGIASFPDLVLDLRGAYTLSASATLLGSVASSTFSVGAASLVYTNPSAGSASIALQKNAASTATTVVLDLVTLRTVSGYGIGFGLPLDAAKVQAGTPLMVAGTALSAGTGTQAAAAALPSSGPLAGVLVAAQSQKAAGGGAVATDTSVGAGVVLFTLRLDVSPYASAGNVFDGASIQSNQKFNAFLRDRQGNNTVSAGGFAIGKLDVQVQ